MAEHDPSRDRPPAARPEPPAANKGAGKTDDRRVREAAALRANLARRRGQRQARAAQAPADGAPGTDRR